MRGVRQIVRFNWPFYATAACTLAIATLVTAIVPMARPLRLTFLIGVAAAIFWIAASLTVSWLVYDRSPLMRWAWVARAFDVLPRTWINIHTGLDESTPALRAVFGKSTGRVFDIFDPREMTEPSIRRARRLAHNVVPAEAVDLHRLSTSAGTVDAALLLLSAHELRTEAARSALFGELHRCIVAGGRVVVAEHLRDWANFLAFGPGFLHFHSRRTWRRCFTCARFTILNEFSMTPFVRIFVLTR
jgi:hypothetical protein